MPSIEEVSTSTTVKCPGCLGRSLNVASVSFRVTYLDKDNKQTNKIVTIKTTMQ